jgi:hypothetical protein
MACLVTTLFSGHDWSQISTPDTCISTHIKTQQAANEPPTASSTQCSAISPLQPYRMSKHAAETLHTTHLKECHQGIKDDNMHPDTRCGSWAKSAT